MLRLRLSGLMLILLIAMGVSSTIAAVAANSLSNSPNAEAIMPAGSVIPVYLVDEVSTETAKAGTPVEAALAQDIYAGKQKVLSRGDRVQGSTLR